MNETEGQFSLIGGFLVVMSLHRLNFCDANYLIARLGNIFP